MHNLLSGLLCLLALAVIVGLMRWSNRRYQLYGAAVVELDPKRLIERVDATEAAIHGRLRDLQYADDISL